MFDTRQHRVRRLHRSTRPSVDTPGEAPNLVEDLRFIRDTMERSAAFTAVSAGAKSCSDLQRSVRPRWPRARLPRLGGCGSGWRRDSWQSLSDYWLAPGRQTVADCPYFQA